MTFEYRDPATCDTFVAQPDTDDDRRPVVFISTTGLNKGVYVPLGHVEEVVAGIRDAARQTGQQPTHSCGNCDGIDPDTCLSNPGRAAAGLDATQPATDRAAILREAADAIDATYTGFGIDRYVRHGADLLRRMAEDAS